MPGNDSPNRNEQYRYKLLFEHYRWEHSSFWVRFGFMLLSQMALLGFCLNFHARLCAKPDSFMSIFALAFPIVGLILVVLFFRLQLITKWWIDKWIPKLQELEPNAIGDLEISRLIPKAFGKTRKIALLINFLFLFVWGVILLVSIGRIWCYAN